MRERHTADKDEEVDRQTHSCSVGQVTFPADAEKRDGLIVVRIKCNAEIVRNGWTTEKRE